MPTNAHYRLLLGLLALMVPPSGVLGQDRGVSGDAAREIAQQHRPSVAQLVEQLDSPRRGAREAAERALLERGPAILAKLPDSAASPATAEALARIRAQLSEQQVVSRVVHPLPVSLAGSGPLEEVAADWLDKTGPVQLALTAPQRRRRVSVNLEGVPYWLAIDTLAAEANLWPADWNEKHRLTFRARRPADEEARLGYVGSFRITAGPVTVKKLPNDTGDVLYRLPIALWAEPRARPLFISHSAKAGQLVTREGTKLAPFTPQAHYELPVGSAGGRAAFSLNFVGPKGDGPKGAGSFAFGGTFTTTVAADQALFRFPLGDGLNRPIERRIGSVTARLRQVERRDHGETLIVELSVVYEKGGPAFESYRTWIYHNQARLVIERTGQPPRTITHEPAYDIVAHTPGALLLRYTFQNVPRNSEAMRFEYEAPTQIVSVPIKVNLEGIPLATEKSGEPPT